MIKCVPFEPWHIENIKPRSCFTDPNLRSTVLRGHDPDITHTFLDDDEVIAIIGGGIIWKGVMHVFSVTSELVKKHFITFSIDTKRLIEWYAKALELHRIQVDVPCDLLGGDRWARFLGFSFECKMKKYGPFGEDYNLYARLF